MQEPVNMHQHFIFLALVTEDTVEDLLPLKLVRLILAGNVLSIVTIHGTKTLIKRYRILLHLSDCCVLPFDSVLCMEKRDLHSHLGHRQILACRWALARIKGKQTAYEHNEPGRLACNIVRVEPVPDARAVRRTSQYCAYPKQLQGRRTVPTCIVRTVYI